MPDRVERIAKFVCVALAALLLFQLGKMVFRRDSLSRLSIPALPTLPPDTNAPAVTAGNGPSPLPGPLNVSTNAVRAATNVVMTGTNVPQAGAASKATTNAPQALVAKKGTNPPAILVEDESRTNGPKTARHSTTNATNVVVGSVPSGTNVTAKASAGPGKRAPDAGGAPQMAMMGMGGFGGRGNTPEPELPLPVRARVYQITDSEILGPVMRPLPTALLGIVGEVAFVRSASGQSGVIKEGENVGALKLLKIGTNRVLVEEDGKTNELMIFSGYGGDSLVTKQKDNSQ